MEFRNLRTLTLVVTIMVVIDALWSPVVLLTATLTPTMFRSLIAPVATTVDMAALCFKIATMIVFARWIYVAGRNLVDADVMDLEFSPASRIWWFFVPVASLFKPFQAMRELWNASHGVMPTDAPNTLVATWWGLWLLSNFMGYVTSMLASDRSSPALAWAVSAADIAAAVAAIMLIREIARGQEQLGNGGTLAEVFA
jgi:hypothetical protein